MKALIVVDMQRDFLEGGALAIAGASVLAERIAKAAVGFGLVVCTGDWHRPNSSNGGHFEAWPPHCVAWTEGSKLAEPLTSITDLLLLKGYGSPGYSAFEGSIVGAGASLCEALDRADVEEVFICGVALEYCVKETALASAQLGFRTLLLKSLCLPVQASAAEAALEQMRWAGIIIEEGPYGREEAQKAVSGGAAALGES